MGWIKRLAQIEKILGFLSLLIGIWFFIDSYFGILGFDRHGFALMAGYLATFLAIAFLVAGFSLKPEFRIISWLGQMVALAAISFAVAFIQ